MEHSAGDASSEHPVAWSGSFIAGAAAPESGRSAAPYFRREFEVGPGLRSARLHMSALGLIEARVNGRRVGDEVLCPGWTSYRHRLVVRSHDVSDLLVSGRNAVGAMVGEGWAVGRLGWASRRAVWSDRPAAFLHLDLDYGDRVEVVVTDHHWRASAGAVLENSIYDGESYDARAEPDGWAMAGFDDREWELAEPVEWDMGTLEPPLSPPIRRIEELAIRELLTTPSGQTVADFGQVLTGWVRLTVDGPPGSVISLRHCELLVDGEPDFESNRTAAATDRYTLRGDGPETWEPHFTFHGFRYVVVDGWPGPMDLESLTAVVIHTDMDRTGWFESSDESLNQLHRNVVWSFRGNAVGIPSDCPQRDERLGWTGDINVFGPTAAFLYDVRGFLGSWLRDVALEQKELDGVPMVVPDALGFGGLTTAVWGDVAVSLPWNLYVEYGDATALRRQYPSMKAFVESVVPLLDERGLWSKGFQFGDWLDPDAPPTQPGNAKTEPALVANAYLSRVLDEFQSAAGVVGEDADRAWAADLRRRVASAFVHEWVAPSGRLANESQTAYALAICFGLLEPDQQERAGRRLAELVTEAGFHIGTGFAGTPWLLHALTRTGQTEIAYRVLTQTTPPSFLYPISMGATTIWERWDAVLPDGRLNSTGMTSLNHYALGTVADWLHRTVGGVEATEAGYRRVRVAPIPGGGLTWARTVHDTVHGRITVQWRNDGDTRVVEVSVPEGITADVLLPGHASKSQETVGPGEHRWEYAVPAEPWGQYSLDTPFPVLRADADVWARLSAVFDRLQPGVGHYIDYVQRQHPNLRAVLDHGLAGAEVETDLQVALSSVAVT